MAPKVSTKTTESESVEKKEYPTISSKLLSTYTSSRPYHPSPSKPLSALPASQKTNYALSRFFETGVWKTWDESLRKEFLKEVEKSKVPRPIGKEGEKGKEEFLRKEGAEGRDRNGRDVGELKIEEWKGWERGGREFGSVLLEGGRFASSRDKGQGITEGDIEQERNRRKLEGRLRGKKMGIYEGCPRWDDVVPIGQDDGEGALAVIAYTEEYAEAMSYLRAIMSTQEHSPRVLLLTSHIISLNPAHYTVWLYRAQTLFALSADIKEELEWVNQIALANQKNYQIWHHRQLLIDNLYDTVISKEEGDEERERAIRNLEESERDFMTQMFDQDSKNYHVWSYRQYLVRKFNLFNERELQLVEDLLRRDVRNNSAWSHRFFLVFSDPKYATGGGDVSKEKKATERDEAIPEEIIDREIEFAKAATFAAPQSQSPWNYLRGVLRKGGRSLSSLECFAGEFVKLEEEPDGVRSSHALDFLADVWEEKGESEKAEKALRLLEERYDRVRAGYWAWRRELLGNEGKDLVKGMEGVRV